MTFDFKTATPDTSLDANAFVFGADTQASASPSIYQLSVLKTFMSDSPTLVTPALGTPSSGTLTSCTGLPISTGVSGLGTGNATALAVNVGSAGAFVRNNASETISGALTLTSATPQLTLGVNATTLGSIKLFGNTSGDVTLKVAAAAGTATVFQLPATNGNSGEFLQTNGSGVLSWAAGGGGVTIDSTAITSGTAGRVLFESATNKVSEDSGFTFDATNNVLTLGTGTSGTVTTISPNNNYTTHLINTGTTVNDFAIGLNGSSFHFLKGDGSNWVDVRAGRLAATAFHMATTSGSYIASSFNESNGIAALANGASGYVPFAASQLVIYQSDNSGRAGFTVGSAGIMSFRGSTSTSPSAFNFYTYGASPPSAPSASMALLYADTSGGKIRIMALFPSGAAQQIAIEP